MIRASSPDEIRKALKKDPKDPSANRLMGALCLNNGDHKEALRFYGISTSFSRRFVPEAIIDFEEYLAKNPENVQARLGLVDFHLSMANFEAAIIELEELVEIAPETAQVYNLLGRIYLKLGRIDGAISLLEKAMDAGKGDPVLLESLAGAYIEKERFSDAVGLYEKLLKSDPRSKRIMRLLSEMYARLSNHDAAALKCSQMLDDDPEVVNEVTAKLESLASLAPGSPVVLEQLADVYARSLKPVQCVFQLSRILSLDPGRLESVTLSLKKLLHTYPENQEAMSLLAQCLTKKGLYSEAVEIYNRLQSKDPSFTDKCIDGFKQIISEYPDQALAHQSLADCYCYKGKLKDAVKEYGAVVRLNPAEVDAVEKKCKEILKQNPGMTEACMVLAEAFLAGGDSRKAIALAEEVCQKEKNPVNAYRVLGEAYLKMEMADRACGAFRSALELSPLDSGIQAKYRSASEKEIDREISQVRAKIEQDPWRAGLNLDLGRLLYRRGQLDGAVRALQNAAKDQTRAVFAHNLMGQIFKEQGRYDLAKVQFEKVFEFKGTGEGATERNSKANIGSCLEATGEVSEAVRIYESILSEDIGFGDLVKRVKLLNSSNTYSVRNKALALVLSGREGGSASAVWGRDGRRSRSVEEDLTMMSFGQGQNNKGVENFVRERIKEAEEDFLLAAQLDTRLIPSVNNLGVVFVKTGDIDKAITSFNNAIIEDSGNPVYHNNLGCCLAIKGDIEGAARELGAALKSDRDFNAASFNLGGIEMKNGKVKEAIAHYKKIGQFDPLYEAASRRMSYWAV